MNSSLNASEPTTVVEQHSMSLMALSEELADSHVCNYFLEQIKLQRPTHAVAFEIADQFKIRCKFAFAIDTLSRLVDAADRTPAIWVRLGEYSGLAGFPENEITFFEKASDLAPGLREKFWYVKSLSDAAFEIGDDEYARSVLVEALKKPDVSKDERRILLQSFARLGEIGYFLDIVNKLDRVKPSEESTAVSTKNVLIIDSVLPRYDQDAGSVLMQGFIRSLVQDGYTVWFYSGEKEPEQKYVDRLLESKVRYVAGEYVADVTEFLRLAEPEVDLFILTRANVGGIHFDTLRNINPDKPVVFNSVDLHYLRLERLYESTGHISNLLEAKRLKRRESYLIRNSDASIIISDAEVKLLEAAGIDGNIWQLPIIVEFPEKVEGFADRKHIAFVGSYVHTPNIDAVDHFCQDVWPDIHEKFGDTRLIIVGPKAPERWMEQYHDKNNVEVMGFVEDLEALLATVKCTIVPLRFGAGQKGKIATSLAHGVPCISTEVGIEGMGLTDKETVLLSHGNDDWQKNLDDVINNELVWNKLSKQGKEYAFNKFSEQVVGSKLVAEVNQLLSVA